jgi:hypothetical protein
MTRETDGRVKTTIHLKGFTLIDETKYSIGYEELVGLIERALGEEGEEKKLKSDDDVTTLALKTEPEEDKKKWVFT